MRKAFITCVLALCFLFIQAVPVRAIGQAEFFNNTTVDESMISFLMEQCGRSVECAKKTRVNSYNEAESFKKDKKFEQSFMAGKFSWYAAVYESVLIADIKSQGTNVEAMQSENFAHLTQMRSFFYVPTSEDFVSILKQSLNMVDAAFGAADGDGTDHAGQGNIAAKPTSPPPSTRVADVPNRFANLLVTCVLGKGNLYPTNLTVSKIFKIWKKDGAQVEWEVLGNNSGMLIITQEDKAARSTNEIRLVFETKEGAQRAMVTRSFFQGMEMFWKDKDQIALDCIVAFDRPQ